MASFTHWMRLHIGDYLSDTMHLTTLQHGAYLLLIMHYFKHGGLPTEDRALARIVKLPVNLWTRNSSPILAMFRLENGVWHHTRIDAERANSERLARAAAGAGESTTTAEESPPTPQRGAKRGRGVKPPKPKPSRNAMDDMLRETFDAETDDARGGGSTVVPFPGRSVGC